MYIVSVCFPPKSFVALNYLLTLSTLFLTLYKTEAIIHTQQIAVGNNILKNLRVNV